MLNTGMVSRDSLQPIGGQSQLHGTPAVSVIMPAYRATAYIVEALDSLRAQAFRDFEVIVVNDGCPDTANLERVLEPYMPEIIYLKTANGGPSSARNAGIKVARAPLVALLDPDDAWEPSYLEVQFGLMQADPSIDVLYPNAVFFGEAGWAGRFYMDVFPSHGDVTVISLLDRKCSIFTGVMARREMMLRAGLYDLSLRIGEDFDLWLRIAKQGGKIAYHRRVLVRYRLRPESLSHDPIETYRQMLVILDKTRAAANLTAAERECLERASTRAASSLDFYLGKKALFSGDFPEARLRLSQANRHMRNRKVLVALLLLRWAPRVLQRLVHFRYKTEYRFLH